MSAQGQQPGRFFNHWFKRLKRFRLLWFLFLSIVIHAALLWRFSLISRHEPRPFSFSKIAILAGLAGDVDVSPSAEPTETSGSLRTRADALPRDRKVASSGVDTAAFSRSETSPGGGNAPNNGESSAGLGNVVTDSGGAGVGGIGSPAGTAGTTTGGTGTGAGSGTGSGTAKGKPQPPKGAPSAPDRSVIAIPPAIQRTTSPYESEVYAEVDFYTLFTPDLRMSVNVPGNEVCLDGDLLRTHERKVLSQRVTDTSKCWFEDHGDNERMRCPKDAYKTVLLFDNYLSSPVKYTVNLCMAYDRSNCYIDVRDDGPEREICRVPGKYEGIWAAGTMFHYQCTKSSSQMFSHPLQYEVRFLQMVEFPEARMRRRVVLREKRPVAPCE